LAAISVLDPFPPAARPILENALDSREPAPARFAAELARKDGGAASCRVHVSAAWNDGPVAALFLEALPTADAPESVPANPGRQALKMEALGRMASGLAHDLSNLLAVVNGYSDHLLAQAGPVGSVTAGLKAIRRAGQSAADLARGLAEVVAGGGGETRPVGVDAALREQEPALRRILGEGIGLRLDLRAGTAAVLLEAGQLERALGNLCSNAREAMPAGGVVGISTEAVEIGSDAGFTHLSADPGPGVSITVEDTGLGMDAAALERLFEPFFTTKRGGRGLGMGLAAVYGMAARAGGGLAVESAPGAGSRFRLCLPRHVASAREDAAVGRASPAVPAPGGSVLVIDDEPYLREMIQAILERAGFTVAGASDSDEAEALLARGPGEVDLVITDVMLPGETGHDLAARLSALKPGLRVLYISGHSRESLADRGIEVPADAFLEKPFTPARLAAAAKALLEAARENG
jgi:signal transduction histidine kinase/ActR/RegA family two-component response regulator